MSGCAASPQYRRAFCEEDEKHGPSKVTRSPGERVELRGSARSFGLGNFWAKLKFHDVQKLSICLKVRERDDWIRLGRMNCCLCSEHDSLRL